MDKDEFYQLIVICLTGIALVWIMRGCIVQIDDGRTNAMMATNEIRILKEQLKGAEK